MLKIAFDRMFRAVVAFGTNLIALPHSNLVFIGHFASFRAVTLLLHVGQHSRHQNTIRGTHLDPAFLAL